MWRGVNSSDQISREVGVFLAHHSALLPGIAPVQFLLASREAILANVEAKYRQQAIDEAAKDAQEQRAKAEERINQLLEYRDALKTQLDAATKAGETDKAEELRAKIAEIKRLGFDGVILEYSLEVLDTGAAQFALGVEDAATLRDIDMWRRGMLETISMVGEGDYIGVK